MPEPSPPSTGPDRISPAGGETPPVTLVVPLYNEEGNVDRVSRSLLEVFRRAAVPLTLVLVENGSRDGTRQQVRAVEAANPEVRGLYLDRNAGYGGGILAGMATAQTELVGYLWGDGQVEADDVLRVYRRLVADRLDIAKARRVSRQDGWRRSVVTRAYNTVTLWWFHIASNDTNGCPKLFRRSAWLALRPRSTDWFLDPEIMIGAARGNLAVGEVDVVARARNSGASKVGYGTIVEFAVNLARERWLR